MGIHAAEERTPEDEIKADAKNRTLRTSIQAVAATALVGAAAAVTELAGNLDVLDLRSVAVAAGTGAFMALAAYVQRRLGK